MVDNCFKVPIQRNTMAVRCSPYKRLQGKVGLVCSWRTFSNDYTANHLSLLCCLCISMYQVRNFRNVLGSPAFIIFCNGHTYRKYKLSHSHCTHHYLTLSIKPFIWLVSTLRMASMIASSFFWQVLLVCPTEFWWITKLLVFGCILVCTQNNGSDTNTLVKAGIITLVKAICQKVCS